MIVLLLRFDRKLTRRIHVLHGLDAVEHEVHQNLLQLHTVCQDLGKIRGKLSTDRNRVPGGLVLQQDAHLSNDFIYVNQLALRRSLLEQQADPVDDVARTFCVFDES